MGKNCYGHFVLTSRVSVCYQWTLTQTARNPAQQIATRRWRTPQLHTTHTHTLWEERKETDGAGTRVPPPLPSKNAPIRTEVSPGFKTSTNTYEARSFVCSGSSKRAKHERQPKHNVYWEDLQQKHNRKSLVRSILSDTCSSPQPAHEYMYSCQVNSGNTTTNVRAHPTQLHPNTSQPHSKQQCYKIKRG